MFQQGEDAIPPSYSVRRGRPTPQLSTHFKYFYLNYSLYTISYSLILRTLPYSIILWAVHTSDWQLALLQREQHQPTTSAGVSPRTTTQASTRAQRTPASFALSASLPFALLATHFVQRETYCTPELWKTGRHAPQLNVHHNLYFRCERCMSNRMQLAA